MLTFECVIIEVEGGERFESAFYGDDYNDVREQANRRIEAGDFVEVIFECEL